MLTRRLILFFIGSGPEAAAIFAGGWVGWTPRLYMLWTLVGRGIADALTLEMRDKIWETISIRQ